MKKVIIVYSGAADHPQAELGGRTPLQAARCPEASRLATLGRTGRIRPATQAALFRPEVDLARMIGVHSSEADLLQRGPLTACGVGLDEDDATFVYTGYLVTFDKDVLVDGSVTASLSTEETEDLLEAVRKVWQREGFILQSRGGGRIVISYKGNASALPVGVPPRSMAGQSVDALNWFDKRCDLLSGLMEETRRVLSEHPVNEVRVDLGENPANGLWLWGGGIPSRVHPELPNDDLAMLVGFTDFSQGLGTACGLPRIRLDTPWPLTRRRAPRFKVTPIVQGLRDNDVVLAYLEAPGDLGYYGPSVADKVRGLEWLDKFVLAPLISILEAYRPYRLLLTTDNLVSSATHLSEPGPRPLVLWGDGIEPDETDHWDEEQALRGSIGEISPGDVLKLLAEA